MTPLNVQPTEQVVHGDGLILELQGVPFKTLQGEGPFSGFPCVFVRLAGCNMSHACRGCDTDYTSDRKDWKVEAIVEEIKRIDPPGVFHPGNRPLVVITGGEPLRQPIGELCRQLVLDEKEFTVQIETNGTLFRADLPWVSSRLVVVCSPKAGKVHDKLRPYVVAYKYPLKAGEVDEADGLPAKMLGGDIKPARPHGKKPLVYVLPMDEGEPVIYPHGEEVGANLKAATESAMKFGYILQSQNHKTWGVS